MDGPVLPVLGSTALIVFAMACGFGKGSGSCDYDGEKECCSDEVGSIEDDYVCTEHTFSCDKKTRSRSILTSGSTTQRFSACADGTSRPQGTTWSSRRRAGKEWGRQ